jgi:hypothetical protein
LLVLVGGSYPAVGLSYRLTPRPPLSRTTATRNTAPTRSLSQPKPQVRLRRHAPLFVGCFYHPYKHPNDLGIWPLRHLAPTQSALSPSARRHRVRLFLVSLRNLSIASRFYVYLPNGATSVVDGINRNHRTLSPSRTGRPNHHVLPSKLTSHVPKAHI